MIRPMLCFLIGIGVWFCHTSVCAQDAPLQTLPSEKSDTIIRKTPLDTIILVNPDGGREIRLTGPWTLTYLDDIIRPFLTAQEKQVSQFAIRNVSANGKVIGNYVETRVQIEIQTTSYQSVRVPLGFKEGILPGDNQLDTPSFCYLGPGDALLDRNRTVDSQEWQYIAVINPQSEDSENPEKPETNQLHTLSLLFWIPLTPNGNEEQRLSLSFPQSNTSLFLLEVPMGNIDASVSRGFLFDVQENAEKTLLQIHGIRTDTEISWGKKKVEMIVDDQPVLRVERATIDVRLDDRSAMYDAVLPVSSETAGFDHLRIRLPQNSVLDREIADRYAVANNYAIEEVSSDSVVTIRFPQKTTGPVSLHLRAAQQFDSDTSDFKRDIAGFEVLGAVRQSGFLTALISPAELKPHWEPGRGIRGGISSNSAGDPRFEFISQPFLLQVRAVAPQIRISVKPDYQFRISRGELTMNAKLSYTVSGAKTDTLYLFLSDSLWNDWEFGSSSIVDTAAVTMDDSGTLMMPLRNSREGSFEIEFIAHRMLDADEKQKHKFVLPIPRPQLVTRSEAATITIMSANNVEVLPTEESALPASEQPSTRGLLRQTRRMMPPLRLPPIDTQQDTLYYLTELSDAVFVADLVFQQQRISASMQTDVRLIEEFNQVTQTISYNVAFALAEQVSVLLPQSLATSNDVQVQWGNRPLELRDAIIDSKDPIPDTCVRKIVRLPEPMSRIDLTFQYPALPLNVGDDDTVPYSLSFIIPEVPITNHRIHFFAPTGYKVELHPESKQIWETYREPRRPVLNVTETFRSVQSPSKIALFVSVSERNVSGTTVVEQAWLQTWLTGTIREDRAVYRLRSANDAILLQLPPDSMRDHPVTVFVENQQIQPNISPTGMLTIPVAPEQYNRSIEISVVYRYTFEISGIETRLTLPYFPDEALVQYQFWQVILQQSKHIIGNPTGWTQEYDWSWNGLFWWRVPSIRKSDIGFEADSQAMEAILSESSQYVFSHLQPTPHVVLYIAKRSWIVFSSSSVALLIGLLLIYVPQSRYAGSLLGLGVVLISVLLYQPPLVLLTLQAATFGVFLALGTGYVYRIFHRQKQWIPPAFPIFDDMSQPYVTPLPASQTVHEVEMDSESANKDIVKPTVANNGQL